MKIVYLIFFITIITEDSYTQDSSRLKITEIEKWVKEIKSNQSLEIIKDSSYSVDDQTHDLTVTTYFSKGKCGELLKYEYFLQMPNSVNVIQLNYLREGKLAKVETLLVYNNLKSQLDFYFANDKLLNNISQKNIETSASLVEISKTTLNNYRSMCNKKHSD